MSCIERKFEIKLRIRIYSMHKILRGWGIVHRGVDQTPPEKDIIMAAAAVSWED